MNKNILNLVIFTSLFTLTPACKDASDSPAAGPHQRLGFHAQVKPGTSLTSIQQACGGTICKLEGSPFVELEFITDASANVQGYLLRTAAPSPSNVRESQQGFEAAKLLVTQHLGKGESFLQSGDPTYWPERSKEGRVVTLTSSDQGFTVLAVGAVGPDSDKIPPQGAAFDLKQVEAWWEKVTDLPAATGSAN